MMENMKRMVLDEVAFCTANLCCSHWAEFCGTVAGDAVSRIVDGLLRLINK